MLPDGRLAFCLRHVGAALRHSPVANLVGVYAKDGRLRVVFRKFITPRLHHDLLGMCSRLLHEAEQAWSGRYA